MGGSCEQGENKEIYLADNFVPLERYLDGEYEPMFQKKDMKLVREGKDNHTSRTFTSWSLRRKILPLTRGNLYGHREGNQRTHQE